LGDLGWVDPEFFDEIYLEFGDLIDFLKFFGGFMILGALRNKTHKILLSERLFGLRIFMDLAEFRKIFSF
jgi:hypothetical protein